MSHHRHRRRNEPEWTKTADNPLKSILPSFSKNDLDFLAAIKPLLSPSGQKLVDLVLVFSGATVPENPPDLTDLLSQLNLPGDNNNLKELLVNLLNTANNPENKTSSNPNLAMLTTLLSTMNQKNKPEDSETP